MTIMLANLAPVLSLIGPVIVLTAWFAMRGHSERRSRFVLLWLGVLLAQVGCGWLAGVIDPGATARGLAMIYSSTCWFLGPVLAPLVGHRNRTAEALALGSVMAPLGGFVGVVLALFTGVINPCGG